MDLRIYFKDGGSTKDIGMNIFKDLPKFIAKNTAKLESFLEIHVVIERILFLFLLIL